MLLLDPVELLGHTPRGTMPCAPIRKLQYRQASFVGELHTRQARGKISPTFGLDRHRCACLRPSLCWLALGTGHDDLTLST